MRCCRAFYCSFECQARSWHNHSKYCVNPTKEQIRVLLKKLAVDEKQRHYEYNTPLHLKQKQPQSNAINKASFEGQLESVIENQHEGSNPDTQDVSTIISVYSSPVQPSLAQSLTRQQTGNFSSIPYSSNINQHPTIAFTSSQGRSNFGQRKSLEKHQYGFTQPSRPPLLEDLPSFSTNDWKAFIGSVYEQSKRVEQSCFTQLQNRILYNRLYSLSNAPYLHQPSSLNMNVPRISSSARVGPYQYGHFSNNLYHPGSSFHHQKVLLSSPSATTLLCGIDLQKMKTDHGKNASFEEFSSGNTSTSVSNGLNRKVQQPRPSDPSTSKGRLPDNTLSTPRTSSTHGMQNPTSRPTFLFATVTTAHGSMATPCFPVASRNNSKSCVTNPQSSDIQSPASISST
eukprot:gene2943-5744_t